MLQEHRPQPHRDHCVGTGRGRPQRLYLPHRVPEDIDLRAQPGWVRLRAGDPAFAACTCLRDLSPRLPWPCFLLQLRKGGCGGREPGWARALPAPCGCGHWHPWTRFSVAPAPTLPAADWLPCEIGSPVLLYEQVRAPGSWAWLPGGPGARELVSSPFTLDADIGRKVHFGDRQALVSTGATVWYDGAPGLSVMGLLVFLAARPWRRVLPCSAARQVPSWAFHRGGSSHGSCSSSGPAGSQGTLVEHLLPLVSWPSGSGKDG